MLVLGRNPGEYVVIDERIIVKVVRVGKDLRLAIDAPEEVKIERGEVYERQNPRPGQLAGLRR